MNAERYARARELFLAARELAADERTEFVARECGGDDELNEVVLGLLARDVGEFLEQPARESALLAAEEPLASGTALGPYTIERVLGEGGFGVVYAAAQSEPLRRRVALKVLRPGAASRGVLARFAEESRTLARMEHDGIAAVFDAGLGPRGEPYFAMELVDGAPIGEFCARGRLDLRERIELLRRVCLAVQHAHHKGVIHRDIKPSNVLVGGTRAEPRPKVIDFGVAKALGDARAGTSLATEAGSLIGTPAYMAPEQAGADARDVDTRADVYALGALAYELLAGSPPFDAERLRRASLAEVARILRDEEPERPSARAAKSSSAPFAARELRGELDLVVMKALEKERERRYASAGELADDFARFLAREPLAALAPSAAYRGRKWIARNRTAAVGALVVLMALLAGLATTLWQARVAAKERDIARDAELAAIADKERAEIEAESVLAVLEFTNRALASSRPENSRGGERTVREMLDDAASVADASFDGRPPEVEGHVRLMLGGAYSSLSRYDEARRQLERALERMRAAQGDAGPDALRALNELAALDGAQGFFDDAEARYRQSIAVCTRTLGAAHLRTKTATLNLAQVLRQRGDFEAALELLEPLCAESELDGDGARRLRLFACQSVASTLAQMGEPARAAHALERVLASQRELLGAEHPEALDTASNLASVYGALGRVADAERTCSETLAAQRRVLGDDHVATAASEVNLAGIRLHQSRFAEAVELYERALATRALRLGAEHPDTRTAAARLELARAGATRSRPAE